MLGTKMLIRQNVPGFIRLIEFFFLQKQVHHVMELQKDETKYETRAITRPVRKLNPQRVKFENQFRDNFVCVCVGALDLEDPSTLSSP